MFAERGWMPSKTTGSLARTKAREGQRLAEAGSERQQGDGPPPTAGPSRAARLGDLHAPVLARPSSVSFVVTGRVFP